MVCPEPSAPSSRSAVWLDLGTEDYDRAFAIQTRLHALRLAGAIPDTAVVLEHTPCVTFGRAAHLEHILATPRELEAAGITVHPTDRGGDVTYHGPGQVVMYAFVDLIGYGKDVHAHARRLEQVVIDVLASFGVEAGRKPQYPGIWTEEGKIGAIGIKVKRWVTLHGISLNVSPDMMHFALIVPCGLGDRDVTSLTRLLGRPVEVAEVKAGLRNAFERVFDVVLVDVERTALGL
jgi:lipoyl(octanoyl) transferase